MKDDENKSNKNNMTLLEAKGQVSKLVQQGVNYRDITKKEFLIEGRVKRFSISEISKTVNESTKNDSKNRDPDVALLFSLFKKGYSSTRAVIKTEFTPKYVEESYRKFQEFEKKRIVPEWFEIRMYELGSEVQDCNNLNEVYWAVKKAVDSHKELEKHFYLCYKCGESIPMREKSLKDAQIYLSQRWSHDSCE